MAVVGEVTSDIVFYVLKVMVLKRGEVARRRMLANPRDVIPPSVCSVKWYQKIRH
jgi:hypothetical protein